MKKMLLIAMIGACFNLHAKTAPVEKVKETAENAAEKMEDAAEATRTGINQQGVTADSQMRSSDKKTELTRRLRAKIMADDRLSTQAHNITIITNENAITLKGPVASKAEKVQLENYARMMAGELKVFNQLEYKRR